MILVTGATGNVGRHLLARLVAAGEPVRAVSRDPAAVFPDGVEAVVGDPARPQTMLAALTGVRGLFVNPRAVRTGAGELLALASGQSVELVVTLSAINVDDPVERQPSRMRGDLNRETEQATIAAGPAWVSLRPSVFATNTIGLWGGQICAGETVFGPYPAATSAPIHERDIAEVSALALTGAVAAGTRLDLTGPVSLTQYEQVAAIGEALGRSLRYEEIPPQTARDAMVARGFPAAFAEGYLAMLASTVGTPATVTTTVADLLHRPATTFAEWALEHAAAFRTAPATVGGIR